jgi:hypothetical protein
MRTYSKNPSKKMHSLRSRGHKLGDVSLFLLNVRVRSLGNLLYSKIVEMEDLKGMTVNERLFVMTKH